jgi:hypothetical protein
MNCVEVRAKNDASFSHANGVCISAPLSGVTVHTPPSNVKDHPEQLLDQTHDEANTDAETEGGVNGYCRGLLR